jgi:hypothetical protein
LSFKDEDGKPTRAKKKDPTANRSDRGASKGGHGKAAKRPSAKKKQARKPAAKPKTGSSKKSARRRGGLARLDDGLVFVLSNPLRVRMLASLNTEGDAGPADLARRLSCSKWDTSYHMKVLRKYDCVELVKVEQVRSVEKKIYRAKVAVEFPTEIWEALPPAVQGMVVAVVFMTQYSDAEVGLVSKAYLKRPESHASWSNLELDEIGWQQTLKLVDGVLAQTKVIEEEAKARMPEGTAPDLVVSLNMSGFVLPDDAAPVDDRVRIDAVKKRVKGKSSLKHSG